MSALAAATPTLGEALPPAAVDLDMLYRRCRPLFEIVRKLAGVVPAACAYLEIWPPLSAPTTSSSPISSICRSFCSILGR
jgi:hypothetical protein